MPKADTAVLYTMMTVQTEDELATVLRGNGFGSKPEFRCGWFGPPQSVRTFLIVNSPNHDKTMGLARALAKRCTQVGHPQRIVRQKPNWPANDAGRNRYSA